MYRIMQNGNSFILGVSGSGKSMLAKQELVNIYLSDPNADIFVIDPEREMTEIVNTLGGENIKLSAASENHINALDMSRDYGDGENPLILKSEFMLSLCRDIVGNLGAKEKSIIDRCTSIVYRDYLLHGCVGEAPTMKAFYDTLLAQTRNQMISGYDYDVIHYGGEIAPWKEMIAVYAVKLNLDTENPTEIATFDEKKADALRQVFWDMNHIQIHTEIEGETVCLYVKTEYSDAMEMAEIYDFSLIQIEVLADLLG